MGPPLAVIVSKCPKLKNVKMPKKKSNNKLGTKEGNNRRSSVYTLHKIVWLCVGV